MRHARKLTLIGLAAILLLPVGSQVSATNDAGWRPTDQADRVVVRKSERKLYLMKDGRVVRDIDVSLGLMPKGHKEVEGDFRTPEGQYTLIERNPASSFFLSIQISYPNEHDQAYADDLGMSPGGQIMIHGRPNVPKYAAAYYENFDWTDGCIAVSNADMVAIWRLTAIDTPIHIYP